MCKVSISVAFRELKNFGIPPGSILIFTRYLVWVCGDCSASSVKVKSTPLSMKDTHLDIYHPVRPFFKWWDKTLYPHYFQNVWATRKMPYHLAATRIEKVCTTSLVRYLVSKTSISSTNHGEKVWRFFWRKYATFLSFSLAQGIMVTKIVIEIVSKYAVGVAHVQHTTRKKWTFATSLVK